MKLINKKYFIAVIVLLWLISLGLMIQDYILHPPLADSNPLSDRKGNLEGSIYKYGIISLIELIGGLLLINYFYSLPRIFRLLSIIVLPALVFFAFIDAMYSGGVPSMHALWLIAEVFIIFIYLFFLSLKSKLSDINK